MGTATDTLVVSRLRSTVAVRVGAAQFALGKGRIELARFDWAAEQGIKLDFNPSYFSHDKAGDGFTLSHADPGIRQFWIDHDTSGVLLYAYAGALLTNFLLCACG